MAGYSGDYRSASDESLSAYLKTIGNIPLLSREEEMALARRIQEGDAEAERELVRHNLKYVVSVANRNKGSGLPLLDLINEGNIGLIRAARRFDPDRGVRFITYAVWWIRQAITQALSEQAHMVRLPIKQAGLLSTSASHELQYYATAFSTIIHELRNHLQVIAGGLGILQKHAPGEEGMVKRALEHITSGVVQSRRFLTKSAELVQPLLRRIVFNREIVDLNEFLSHTIELLKARVTSIPQPVRVKLELGLGLPPVSICTSSIHRVLEHLLQNAVEAMAGGGDVTISTEYVKESGFPFVRVEVVDTGQGMDGEACRLALQPFYTTKPNHQGLGLPFSRQTMRDHGGNLTVESTPMGGTRVRLIFRDLPGSAGASQETQELAEAGLTVNPDRMSQ